MDQSDREEIRSRQDLFAGALAVSTTRFDLAQQGQSELVDGLWASGRTFEVLGVPAMIGRTFTEADDRPGGGAAGPVAMISHAFWQRRFDGQADAIGQQLVVERVPFTIVGVTPPEFYGVEVGRTFDVAVPVGTATLIRGARVLEQRSMWWLRIMIRLKPDQTAAGTALVRAVQPQILGATRPDDWHPSQIASMRRAVAAPTPWILRTDRGARKALASARPITEKPAGSAIRKRAWPGTCWPRARPRL